MNSLEYIKNIYKPYRITKMKNATIIDSSEGKFVLKKEKAMDVRLELNNCNYSGIPLGCHIFFIFPLFLFYIF